MFHSKEENPWYNVSKYRKIIISKYKDKWFWKQTAVTNVAKKMEIICEHHPLALL